MSATHDSNILSQFTKLAQAFGAAPQLTDSESLDVLVRATGATHADRSLDVACGAGVVACHFARTVQVAEGVDITPAMLNQAKARQAREQLTNLRWTQADVSNLPFADSAFTVVTSRYAIHHMLSPSRVLGEMKRVCTVGGRIAIADICLPDALAEAEYFDRIERMNDPSHSHALTESEWFALFEDAGLPKPAIQTYVLRFPLVGMLRAAARSHEEISSVEAEVRRAAASGKLPGIAAVDAGTTWFCYPIAVFSVERGAA